MNRVIKQAKRRLHDLGLRVLHDATADVFYVTELYHRQHVGTYTRAEFLSRWCGVEA